MDLTTALQTVVEGARAYFSGLSPSEKQAYNVGLHATHFEEAIAQGDFARASAHATALGQLLDQTSGSYVMHVGSDGSVASIPLPESGPPSVLDGLSDEDRQTIATMTMPIPGLLIAKAIGAAWPIATVAGVLSAPLVMYLASKTGALKPLAPKKPATPQ
jgi:hypothetical protein